jgi:hypothetical protein
MRKKRNTMAVVRAQNGPFSGSKVLLTHVAGEIETAVFRVGKYLGKYAGRVSTGHVDWVSHK